MDYEKKYKDAMGMAEEITRYYKEHNRGDENSIEDLEQIFPELKESEDERIMRNIIAALKGEGYYDCDLTNECIAWVEKQGKPQDKGEISDGYHTFNELYYYRMLYNAAFFNMLPKEWVHKSKRHNDGEECFGGGWFIVMANLPTGQISNHYELKDWDLFQIPEKEVADKWDGHTPQEAADRLHKYLLEKQSEQKPFDYEHATITQKDFAPEQEPKFKVGDYIVNVYRKGRVVKITNDAYLLDTEQGIPFSWYSTRLWDITRDAKDGDVLAGKIDGDDYILIFKQIKDGWIETYGHYYNAVDRFCVPSQLFCRDYQGTLIPATKEQRDLLFQKMKEAGYEWDVEKKELKLLITNGGDFAPQQEWSEEDEKMANDLIEGCLSSGKAYHLVHTSKEIADWLKSLKDRIKVMEELI